MQINKRSHLALVGIASVASIALLFYLGYDKAGIERTIKVQDEGFELLSSESFAPQILENCKNDVHCAMNSLQSISENVEKEQVVRAFGDTIDVYRKNNSCHELSHHLGMWFYGYLGNVTEALSYSDQVCGGGIFHGVIESYLLTEKFRGKGPEDLNLKEICPRPDGNPNNIEHWQCIHGLGHGLAHLYKYDISSAIKRCDEFDGNVEQLSCSKGIFMQNVVNYYETGNGDFKKDDVLYPCNTVDSRRAPACYHYQSSYILKLNNGLVKDTFDECDKIVPEEMVKYCYYGFGRQLQAEINNDINNAVGFCTIGDKSEYHNQCIKGMLLTLVNTGTDTSGGFLFCKALPDEYKSDCYDGFGKWIKILAEDLDSGFIELECAKAENKNYAKICINAEIESSPLI